MKKSKLFLLTSLLLVVTMSAFAQKEKKEIRAGNDRYEKGNYSDAETEYRKALEKNQTSYPGTYNLGGALYRQKKFDEAVQQYQQAIDRTTDPKEKASSYHNLGNSMVKAQKYAESIDAYKKALKLNPSDNDTRYNLAYAQAMLRKQQEQQQQDQQNQNQDQQNKDQKNQQNKDQQQKDQKNQDQKSQDQKNKEQQKDQQKKEAQQPKISKEDAERLLKALKNDEQNLQQKLSRKEGEKIRIEKDW
jgi:Ca-activated chloride channel homolog